MEKTNISNLKNRLGAYLRKVRAGESVLVLDRNRPIARIDPVGGIADAGPRVRGNRLARLEAAGLVRRPTRPLPLKLLKTPPPAARQSVLQALLAERGE